MTGGQLLHGKFRTASRIRNPGYGSASFRDRAASVIDLYFGFTTAKIRKILQDQNMWLTLIGIVLGTPCGMWLVAMLFGTMPESMDYIATYRINSFIYTAAGTCALSFAVNRLLSGKVKTVDMVDALKGQE